MEKYNYLENMVDDILAAIKDNYNPNDYSDRDEMEQVLYDDLWIDDGVTGNASGSYYCNAWKAEEAVNHNWDLLQEALEAFSCEDINPIEKGAEWCDVTIRCYLLGQAIAVALDRLEAAGDTPTTWGE